MKYQLHQIVPFGYGHKIHHGEILGIEITTSIQHNGGSRNPIVGQSTTYTLKGTDVDMIRLNVPEQNINDAELKETTNG